METPEAIRETGKSPPYLYLKLREFIADILFPRACISCGKPDIFFCESCLQAVPRRRVFDCPICRTVRTPDGETCLRCRKRSALDGVFAPAIFHEQAVVAEAIHALKYEFVPDLALPLGTLLAERARDTDLSIPDIIIPVPLHPWRMRYRGFNQSALIARSFSESFIPGFPIPVREDILIRKRFTLPQAKSRNAKERKENLRDAFSLSLGNPDLKRAVKGKVVWLVDDVATTGTTLEECARTLKKSGAKKIFGVVVAQ
ncbi:MAG: ComF family protein [Candidatus Moranbacteria bacterium]|nr:ComF family protein [Candidatus Moranbacteria bacterium]